MYACGLGWENLEEASRGVGGRQEEVWGGGVQEGLRRKQRRAEVSSSAGKAM